MSDFNDGVDDYRGKNQMNGASGNAGYSQNGQAYGQQYGQSYSQQYGQSAQHHDQMQKQPQFASPYGQPVQQQMNQQQMGQSYGRHAQPQMSQQQFGQKPYGQPVQPRMSQQPPYGQPPIGRPYGSPAFADRAGYVNGRFNSSYIEEQARKFSFRWNAKEIISAIMIVVIAAIFAFVFTKYGIYFSSNISQTIESVVKYYDKFHILKNVIYYMQYMFPFTIVLSFAQVLRKRFFTLAGGLVVAVSVFLTLFFIFNIFGSSKFIYRIFGCLLQCATIIVFVIFVEIFQLVITKYKPENDLKYMLVNFISVIIFCIANILRAIYIISWLNLWGDSSILNLLLDIVESFIVAIPMLVILPYLVALLLKAVKFTKFLNPEREMMQL
ncbi:hypothetical protein [Gardnerella vaginalis]|uniref:hypothetical protein n=1 Tax=Gardnerella vaginalis TaxID=2702 RepID=UPI0039F0288C